MYELLIGGKKRVHIGSSSRNRHAPQRVHCLESAQQYRDPARIPVCSPVLVSTLVVSNRQRGKVFLH